MRNAITMVAAGAAMMLMAGASFAGPVSTSDPAAGSAFETGVLDVQWGGHGYCERLRWRCENKYRLGEEGMGNCQRYREECGGRSRYCERLRWKCEHKYELGQEGEGNCRRYRAECGGRGAF